MRRETLRWISPVGLANIVALVLGVAGVLFLLMAGLATVVELVRPTAGPPGIGLAELAMFALLPFAYAAFGWLLGYLVAFVFNRVSPYFGGIQLEVGYEAESPAPASRVAASGSGDLSSVPHTTG